MHACVCVCIVGGNQESIATDGIVEVPRIAAAAGSGPSTAAAAAAAAA